MNFLDTKIAVMGMGYVGLPLACEFGKYYPTIGFDIDVNRTEELTRGYDKTGELNSNEIKESVNLTFSASEDKLIGCNIFVIAVPTPIDLKCKPDITYLLNATTIVGKHLKKGDYVIYESTVYPGCTEEDCIPVLEEQSNLVFNEDFYCGYSPERINPGDKIHRLTDIVKVVSCSTRGATKKIAALYSKIIRAGVYIAESIKVAEAAKIIENTQRDINIALINELSIIFNKLGIDTSQVLSAASTKWNFINFKPGLVGGHCIGVDPYYLAEKALSAGYRPEIILAGRALNDSMAYRIGQLFYDKLIEKDIAPFKSRILILGFAFKEDCSDIRNTKIIDIKNQLNILGCNNVDIVDPCVRSKDCFHEYGVIVENEIGHKKYDGVIICVPHAQFIKMGIARLKNSLNDNSVIFDLKGIFNLEDSDFRL